MSVEQTFERAQALHRAGDLEQAEGLYREVLREQPGHAMAHYSMGLLILARQTPAGALAYLKAACEADPEQEEFCLKYIDTLVAAGDLDAAGQMLDRASQRRFNPVSLMRAEFSLNAARRGESVQAWHERVMDALAARSMGRLEGRVAIVTGAASGIGRATALLFAKEGARVVAADINEAGLDDLRIVAGNSSDNLLCVRTDVTSDASVKNMVERAADVHGRIDVLVNNAGINTEGGVLALSPDEWHRTIDTNLSSIYRICHFAVPEIVRHGAGGSIVNLASIQGTAGFPNSGAYAASKGGVIALTRQLMRDFARYQIRVNSISPGVVNTPIFDTARNKERIFELVSTYAPLGFVGVPEDVAFACLFLASDESRYVTGVNLAVDGGMAARSA